MEDKNKIMKKALAKYFKNFIAVTLVLVIMLGMIPIIPLGLTVSADDSINLDLSDLSKWFIYDHYSTESGGYSLTDSKFNAKRPYFSIKENY